MTGIVKQAQLVAAVDELMQWKRLVELRHDAMIDWQTTLLLTVKDLQDSSKNTLQGCGLLMETDTTISARIDDAWKRIDIVNIRLRKLEESK